MFYRNTTVFDSYNVTVAEMNTIRAYSSIEETGKGVVQSMN
jgi:hypothetical protein